MVIIGKVIEINEVLNIFWFVLFSSKYNVKVQERFLNVQQGLENRKSGMVFL